MIKIVFDSGSTKIAAAVIDSRSKRSEIVEIPNGYNAMSGCDGDLSSLVGTVASLADVSSDVSFIYYYGAGCATSEACERVVMELHSIFPNARINVHSDMLGAARAVCGDNSGIVGILGTGSNSCLYDGRNVVDNVSPLGYILGDEGSGAVIGRLFIGQLFKDRFPKTLREEFDAEFNLAVGDIITRVYRQPGANRFLASFAPFIASRAVRYPEVEEFLYNEFCRYVSHNLLYYDGFDRLPVHFVGSIALNFKDYITRALGRYGGHLGMVTSAPIHGLVQYHTADRESE